MRNKTRTNVNTFTYGNQHPFNLAATTTTTKYGDDNQEETKEN